MVAEPLIVAFVLYVLCAGKVETSGCGATRTRPGGGTWTDSARSGGRGGTDPEGIMGEGVVWDFGDDITAVVGRDGQVAARQDGRPIPDGRAETGAPQWVPPAGKAAAPLGGLALAVGVAVGRYPRLA